MPLPQGPGYWETCSPIAVTAARSSELGEVSGRAGRESRFFSFSCELGRNVKFPYLSWVAQSKQQTLPASRERGSAAAAALSPSSGGEVWMESPLRFHLNTGTRGGGAGRTGPQTRAGSGFSAHGAGLGIKLRFLLPKSKHPQQSWRRAWFGALLLPAPSSAVVGPCAYPATAPVCWPGCFPA